MKKSITRNALIGLAFIASLFMIYFGINFLKGVNVLKQQKQYYALFDDVSSLLLSSPLYVKGYQIGLINSIKMASAEPMRFAVGINLEEEISIPEDSYLEYGIDLFGASTANLILGSSPTLLHPGDTIRGSKVTGLMDGAAGLMPRADSLFLRIDSLLLALHRIIAHPSWEQSIDGIAGTVQQLNSASQSLHRMVTVVEKDLPEISRNLHAVSQDLRKVSGELSEMDLNRTYVTIDETVNNLKQLTGKINSSDNSLGLLINDTKLHDSLSVTIETATKLLEDIRQHPERYLSVKVRLF
ncbi:MAG: MlaD family protein [Proteiniphilum sp.]|nr:MlaD family protein [Proteiniphilum sp.]MDD4158501.1 MlaD family protein [Proteiniphilum sp.]MDD4800278.1 MlaD family protein [Proteiniphilum sp.]